MTTRTTLSVYVQPRASRTEVVGLHDGSVKIRLAAPPVDGAANAALIEFVAKTLRVPKRNVSIASGQSNRRKILEIEGVTSEELFSHFPHP